MRHGRSLANEEGIILSNLVDGTNGWGLAEGADIEIKQTLKNRVLPSDTLIFSSPFKRAHETALVAAANIGCTAPLLSKILRERFFGDLDKKGDYQYRTVWVDDAANPDNRLNGVESPADVLKRLLGLINETNSNYSGRTILFVSHGDPLNILLTHAAGIQLSRHMKIVGMKTAELRPLSS
jgi:broad specificity phosphatase PhoE